MTGVAHLSGTRLAYELAGEGPPVVLVHGFSLDMSMWDEHFDALSERYRVLRYDARGYGLSQPPRHDEPYSHAEDLHELISALGMAGATVVGFSLGGSWALELALRHPRDAGTLVLVDSTLRGHRWNPEWVAAQEECERIAREVGVEDGKAIWAADVLFAWSRSKERTRARLDELIGRWSGWQLVHDDPCEWLDPPLAERLGEIRKPTLALVGEHDIGDFRAVARRLANEIPAARLEAIAGAGHMSPIDEPEAFRARLLRFLEETA
ncbi:MAG: alpha/beta fold hydrolase [Thermoleophilaceae bacterium]|nr:alpha/beta fold hydrolase [Thermoleophilaceae bacterium]